MDILTFNFYWMTFNVILAFIAVFAGLVMVNAPNKVIKYIFAFIWLLFVPNTLYLFTDIIHLPEQWFQVEGFDLIILFFQYIVLLALGAFTFVYSIILFEKAFLVKKKYPLSNTTILIILNFVIAFGIVLGRVQRTNSWEVFTDLFKVIQDGINVITSIELILLIVFFGVLGNVTYFLLIKLPFFHHAKK